MALILNFKFLLCPLNKNKIMYSKILFCFIMQYRQCPNRSKLARFIHICCLIQWRRCGCLMSDQYWYLVLHWQMVLLLHLRFFQLTFYFLPGFAALIIWSVIKCSTNYASLRISRWGELTLSKDAKVWGSLLLIFCFAFLPSLASPASLVSLIRLTN